MGSKTRSAARAHQSLHRIRLLIEKELAHGDRGAVAVIWTSPPSCVQAAAREGRATSSDSSTGPNGPRSSSRGTTPRVTTGYVCVRGRGRRPGPFRAALGRAGTSRRIALEAAMNKEAHRLTRMKDQLVQRSRPRHGTAGRDGRRRRRADQRSESPTRPATAVVDRGSDRHRQDGARARARPVEPGPLRAGIGRRHGRVPPPRPRHRQTDAGRASGRALASHRHRRSVRAVLRRRVPSRRPRGARGRSSAAATFRVLVGGTGLYHRAVVDDLEHSRPVPGRRRGARARARIGRAGSRSCSSDFASSTRSPPAGSSRATGAGSCAPSRSPSGAGGPSPPSAPALSPTPRLARS